MAAHRARAKTTLSSLNEHKLARPRRNASKSHSIQKLRTINKRRESEKMTIKQMTLKGKVTGHAQRQVRRTNDWTSPIDWTGLNTPAQVCQAVWHLHIMDKIFQD